MPKFKRFLTTYFEALLSTLAVGLALLIGAVILLALRVNPLAAYGAMAQGALGNVNGLTQTVATATPLLFVGLGICIAFRSRVINIGGEGQLVMGALAATAVAVALALPGLPKRLV